MRAWFSSVSSSLRCAFRFAVIPAFVLSASAASFAQIASTPEDFVGLWTTEENKLIIQTRLCKRQAFTQGSKSICGRVVYDVDAKDPSKADATHCNRRIVQFDKFEDNSWQDGWAFNIRDNQSYRARMFINKPDEITLRVYIGKETQSKTYLFHKVSSYPSDCKGLRPGNVIK